MNVFGKPSRWGDGRQPPGGGMMPWWMMPGQMMPGQMMPRQIMPGQMMPDQMMPGQSMPGQSMPGQSMPGQSMPGQSMPGQSMPDQSMPGQSMPGQMMPGQVMPGQMTPGQSMPGQMMPGQVMPGQMTPGQSMPGQSMPGQSMPGQSMPGQSMPGQSMPGQMMPGQVMPGQMTPGQSMPGQMMPGQMTPGQMTPDQLTPGVGREAHPEARPRGEITPTVPELRPQGGELSAFVQRIAGYLADEVTANAFYRRLASETDDETIRGYLQEAAEDEQKHFRLLSELYQRLTGRTIQPTPTPVEYSSLREGLLIAANDEIEAYEGYKDEYQRFSDPYLRWLFFELFSDEIEHAVRFNTALHIMAGQ